MDRGWPLLLATGAAKPQEVSGPAGLPPKPLVTARPRLRVTEATRGGDSKLAPRGFELLRRAAYRALARADRRVVPPFRLVGARVRLVGVRGRFPFGRTGHRGGKPHSRAWLGCRCRV